MTFRCQDRQPERPLGVTGKDKNQMNNNVHIIAEPVGLMRKIARDALRGHWKEVFVGVLIYAVLTDYIAGILNMIFPSYREIELYGQTLTINQSFVGSLYTTILVGAFTYGMTLFLLTFFRTKKTNNALIFEGFSMPVKTIGLQIVITIRIFLWTLLFIIPGIIAAFRYSMAYYILADHPDYTITQCIEESKARMMGNKGTLFTLYLSFIGWSILASIAGEGLASIFGTGTVGNILGIIVGSIPNVFLGVYVKTSETVFYELLTGNLVVMTPDQQVRDQGVRPENMVNADYHVNENDNAGYTGYARPADNSGSNGYTGYVSPDQAQATDNSFEEAAYDEQKVAEDIANDTMKAAEDALRELRAAADARGSEPFGHDEVDEFGGPKNEKDDL